MTHICQIVKMRKSNLKFLLMVFSQCKGLEAFCFIGCPFLVLSIIYKLLPEVSKGFFFLIWLSLSSFWLTAWSLLRQCLRHPYKWRTHTGVISKSCRILRYIWNVPFIKLHSAFCSTWDIAGLAVQDFNTKALLCVERNCRNNITVRQITMLLPCAIYGYSTFSSIILNNFSDMQSIVDHAINGTLLCYR